MLLCGMNKLPQLYRSELEELKNLLQVTQQSATAPSCISHYPSLRMVHPQHESSLRDITPCPFTQPGPHVPASQEGGRVDSLIMLNGLSQGKALRACPSPLRPVSRYMETRVVLLTPAVGKLSCRIQGREQLPQGHAPSVRMCRRNPRVYCRGRQ